MPEVILKTSLNAPANSWRPRRVAASSVKNPFWSPAYRDVVGNPERVHEPKDTL